MAAVAAVHRLTKAFLGTEETVGTIDIARVMKREVTKGAQGSVGREEITRDAKRGERI